MNLLYVMLCLVLKSSLLALSTFGCCRWASSLRSSIFFPYRVSGVMVVLLAYLTDPAARLDLLSSSICSLAASRHKTAIILRSETERLVLGMRDAKHREVQSRKRYRKTNQFTNATSEARDAFLPPSEKD